MNYFLGEKVAIVSPKPQTTRDAQYGILTQPDAQIIFVDTPGIHEPSTMLGEYMVDAANSSLAESDVILFLVDLSTEPDSEDIGIASLLGSIDNKPIVLAMNKGDRIKPGRALPYQAAYHALVPEAEPFTISAATGDGCDRLLSAIIGLLPKGPLYFPTEQITDTHVRDNAADLIREQVLMQFGQEVPHAVAVQIEDFKERNDNLIYIAATIFVERESQKGILIGKNGRALKRLGEAARPAIESMLGVRVYLELWVKVLKNWRKDERALRRLGYRVGSGKR
jgi:GTP-binding protein Era